MLLSLNDFCHQLYGDLLLRAEVISFVINAAKNIDQLSVTNKQASQPLLLLKQNSMGETILGVGVLCWGDQTKKSNQTPRVINPFTIYTYKELVYNPKCQLIIKQIVLLPNCRDTFPVTIIMVSINQDLSFPEARNQISNEKGIY